VSVFVDNFDVDFARLSSAVLHARADSPCRLLLQYSKGSFTPDPVPYLPMSCRVWCESTLIFVAAVRYSQFTPLNTTQLDRRVASCWRRCESTINVVVLSTLRSVLIVLLWVCSAVSTVYQKIHLLIR